MLVLHSSNAVGCLFMMFEEYHFPTSAHLRRPVCRPVCRPGPWRLSRTADPIFKCHSILSNVHLESSSISVATNRPTVGRSIADRFQVTGIDTGSDSRVRTPSQPVGFLINLENSNSITQLCTILLVIHRPTIGRSSADRWYVRMCRADHTSLT